MFCKIEMFIYNTHSHTDMKEVRIVLEDSDFELLNKLKDKDNVTWRELLLAWIQPKKKVGK